MFHDVAIRASFASGSSSCLNSAQLARPFVEQIREESSWAADAARNRIPSATPVPVPTWPRATWVCCSQLSHLLLTYLLSLINQCQQTAPVSVNSDITLFLFLTFFFPPETFKFFFKHFPHSRQMFTGEFRRICFFPIVILVRKQIFTHHTTDASSHPATQNS